MKKLYFCLLCLLFCGVLSLAVLAAEESAESMPSPILIAVLVGLGVGLLTAGITLFCLCRAMNTVRKKGNAAGYVKDGSFRLSECRDVFLYSRVSRVRINTNNNKR